MSTVHTSSAPGEMSSAALTGSMQLVSFRLADEEYGIEIKHVREIILLGAITRVPQTPAYVKGLINLRSTVIPVLDLRRRFGLPEHPPTDASRIMVVYVRGKTVGIVVDAVNEVRRISTDLIAPPPPTVMTLETAYVTGLVKLENQLLILLDVEKVVGETEGDVLQSAAAPGAVTL